MTEKAVVSFVFPMPPLSAGDSVHDEAASYAAGDEGRRSYDDLRSKTYLSDMMFSLCLRRSPRVAEYLVRTVTGESDIEIGEVYTGYEVRNLGHSVILDALAVGRDGTLIDLEMQAWREASLEKRLRMYESSLSLSFLKKGAEYGDVPRIITIVFLDHDMYGKGKGCILYV